MRSAVADEAPAYPSQLRPPRRGRTARGRNAATHDKPHWSEQATDMPSRSDTSQVLHDLQHLLKVQEILATLSDIRQKRELLEKQQSLAAAEQAVCQWEERRQAAAIRCADTPACFDLRCRRRKCCMAQRWLSSKAETAQARLAAERAKWPAAAPETDAAPPAAADKRKGRTGVRP